MILPMTRVCVCVCVCACVRACVHVCMRVGVCLHPCLCLCMCVCASVYVYVYVCTWSNTGLRLSLPSLVARWWNTLESSRRNSPKASPVSGQ